MPVVEQERSSFSVHVDYIPSSVWDLEGAFDHIDDVLYAEDGSAPVFEPIARCADVSREPRQLSVEYMTLKKASHIEDALKQMTGSRVRPALGEELLDFGKANQREQCRFPIMGIGSTVKVNGRIYVPCLTWIAHCRFLEMKSVEDLTGWAEPTRFLVVHD